MKKISLATLFACLIGFAHAQVFNRLNAPVTQNDTPLENPWVGGLNGPQWSGVDLNNDGKQDLYAFDRNGDKHLTFLNVGGPGETKYQFAPQYAANFPFAKFYTLLRDYNRDGIMDLFVCSLDLGIAGLKVYTGSFANNQLVFEQVQFPWIFDVLLLEVSGAPTNLPINATDYPAVDDLDGDGDLDVLAFGISGSKVHLYQNMALEQGYTDDTLIFEQVDDCWGGFYIPAFSESMLLSPDADNCVFFQSPDDPELEERNGVHGGATICTLDEDNDGDKEILFGDLIYPHIIRGKNCGTNTDAWVCEQDTLYPNYDYTIDIFDFPAAYNLDVDNDGIKDLLASPNISSGGVDENVVWFYKNTQTDEFPVFDFKTDFFIVGDMIDQGTGANPCFVDYNADGLLDFVMGNETVYKQGLVKDSRLFLYKNVGTQALPAFELVDSDWLNFSQFIDPNLQPYAYAPTFGDVDADGDEDLVVGERHGRFFYAENIAGAGNPMSFAPIVPYWQGISVGQFSTPCIHDINKDGLGDLIVGEYKGTINYLPNIGTPGNPLFHSALSEAPNNEYLGAISTQQLGWSSGYSAPDVIENAAGDMFLVTGSEEGFLSYYKINPDSAAVFGASFELIDKKLGGLRDGRITRPHFANLNGDDLLDCVVGNYRGGLGLFSSPILTDGNVPTTACSCPAFDVKIYPNPTNDLLNIRVVAGGSSALKYRVFNSIGQFVSAGTIQQSAGQLDVSHFSQGFYFLEVNTSEGKITKRFVKQ